MTKTEAALLPEEFVDLEPFAKVWSIPGRNDRYQRRLASTMQELQTFYDAMMPRGEEILAYVDQFPMDDLPDPVVHLMWLLSSLSIVSLAVEIYQQPKVPDTGSTYVAWYREPLP
jgi:hypothetical protein